MFSKNALNGLVSRLFLAISLLFMPACQEPISEPSPPGLVRTLEGHTGLVSSVAWSPDGKLLASGSWDSSVRVWNVNNGQSVTKISNGSSIISVAWSPDGKYLVSGFMALADSFRLAETSSWETIYRWDTGLSGDGTGVSWSPTGETLAVCSDTSAPGYNSALEILEMGAKKAIATLIEPGDVNNVSWSPDGKLLAFTSTSTSTFGLPESMIMLWDPSKGGGMRTSNNTLLVAKERSGLLSLAWSPDGKQLVSGSRDHLVKVWDVASGQNTVTFIGHARDVRSVAWSPDSKQIASGSWDRTARIWDVSNGTEIANFTHPGFVNSVAWSPDGLYLASGTDTVNNIFIWKAK